jgi:hypothetical protein
MIAVEFRAVSLRFHRFGFQHILFPCRLAIHTMLGDNIVTGILCLRSTSLPMTLLLMTLIISPAAADQDDLPFRTIILAAAEGTVQQRSEVAPITPPEPQRWAIGFGALYTQREGETAAWLPSLEVNYSPSDRLQLHSMIPIVYDRLDGFSAEYGVGDLELGIRYRFIDEDPQGWRPSVAVYPLIDLPTGDASRNLGTGRIHAFLPLWFSKAFGSWIPFGGGGYWINPGPSNKNWTFAAVGIIHVLSAQWSLNGQIFYASSPKVGIKEQTGFSVGGRYNLTDNHHFLLSVGRGLQNASVTNEITSYFQYALTF